MVSKNPSMAGYGRCPICGDRAETAFRPFCSARCRDVDLARWLGGGYAIPRGREEADEDGADADALRTRDDRGDDRS
jgi:endogenous inhibitor of DNA gyrase (YacG/DUF329 family)